jgi:hypothetical protein
VLDAGPRRRVMAVTQNQQGSPGIGAPEDDLLSPLDNAGSVRPGSVSPATPRPVGRPFLVSHRRYCLNIRREGTRPLGIARC